MLFANSNFKDLLVEGALFNLGIEIQCVSEHVWVGHGGLRGRGGELPAGGIRASQGTFSSYFLLKKCENPLHCKGFSQSFSTKNNSVFVILPFEILTNP